MSSPRLTWNCIGVLTWKCIGKACARYEIILFNLTISWSLRTFSFFFPTELTSHYWPRLAWDFNVLLYCWSTNITPLLIHLAFQEDISDDVLWPLQMIWSSDVSNTSEPDRKESGTHGPYVCNLFLCIMFIRPPRAAIPTAASHMNAHQRTLCRLNLCYIIFQVNCAILCHEDVLFYQPMSAEPEAPKELVVHQSTTQGALNQVWGDSETELVVNWTKRGEARSTT